MRKYILLTISVLFLAFTFSGNPPSGWYLQTLPVNKIIGDIYFIDSLTGWTGTTTEGHSQICYFLKTTNGGDNWTISLADDSMSVNKIQFLNANTGYIAGGYSRTTIFKTTNGGDNWTRLFKNLGTPVFDMQFVNADTGWYCMNDIFTGCLYRTTNGGLNWVRQLDQTYDLQAMHFANKDTGYVINSQNLYKTINGGINWSLQYSFEGGLRDDINFLNSQTGWITRGNQTDPSIFKTVNGGSNWSIQNGVPRSDTLTSLLLKTYIINKDTLWAIGGSRYFRTLGWRGILFISTNGGNTWGYQLPDTNLGVQGFLTAFFTSKKQGWAYQTFKGIHTKIGGNDTNYYVTGVNDPISEVPKNFTLHQNYPNPFNPTTKLNYELKISSFITLKVFDLQGKEIQTLVNKKQSVGNYSVEFNATNLSSGIYFYTLQAGDFIDTKKMILVK